MNSVYKCIRTTTTTTTTTTKSVYNTIQYTCANTFPFYPCNCILLYTLFTLRIGGQTERYINGN